jgi:hypothetical protein
MDKFTKNGYEVYELWLNHMHNSHAEHRDLVAISFSADKLRDWMSSLEDRHTDGRWNKSFKNGSPLELYNYDEEIRKVARTEYQLSMLFDKLVYNEDSNLWHV